MSRLHDFLKTYINDLQQLLDAYPEENALMAAVEQKWPEDDLRRDFVITVQTETNFSGTRKRLKDMGGEENGGRENIPVGIKDMGGEENEERENIAVGKKP
jgi:hypothetical protein